MRNHKKKPTAKNAKYEDGAFPSKNIKHDPSAEGARAVFGKKQQPQEHHL